MSEQKPISEWLGVNPENWESVFKAIETGEIAKFDRAKLLEAARFLAAFHSHHVGQDQTAAALLIHNLQIAHTLQEIDRSNRRLQILVTILAVVALAVGVLQTYFTVFPRNASGAKPAMIAQRNSAAASATEVFNLRSKCEELAQKIEDEDLIGPALTKSHISHYDPMTNRCYVQVDVQTADPSKEFNITSYLYDGQTHELLASEKTEHGKTTGWAPGIASEDAVHAMFEEKMSDDRRQ